MGRISEINRKTTETEICLTLNLDGRGRYDIDTGCGFLDHMMELFARHGRFDLKVKCKGDIKVDYHHTAEDIGIALGTAFKRALGTMEGITRYSHVILPMDETLMLCALDISGRDYLGFDVTMPSQKVGDMDTELIKEFFLGFVRKAQMTIHFRQMAGENTHHIIEAMFKAFGRSLSEAVKIEKAYENEIPSTKGVL